MQRYVSLRPTLLKSSVFSFRLFYVRDSVSTIISAIILSFAPKSRLQVLITRARGVRDDSDTRNGGEYMFPRVKQELHAIASMQPGTFVDKSDRRVTRSTFGWRPAAS